MAKIAGIKSCQHRRLLRVPRNRLTKDINDNLSAFSQLLRRLARKLGTKFCALHAQAWALRLSSAAPPYRFDPEHQLDPASG